MTLFQKAASEPAGSRTPLRSLRAVLRLTLTAWHVARGVCLVGIVFPRLSAVQRQDRMQRWSCAVLRSLGVGVQLQGRMDAGAQLLVANHVSWLDVIVMLALFPHARFVSKSEVRCWPLIGRLVVGAGTFFVERDRPRQTGRAVDAIAAALASGETVAIFPEGTTSDGRTVLPFRASLLQAAVLASVPLRPMALRYADAHHPVSPNAPYIDADTLLGSLWRTARAEGLVACVQVLPKTGPAMVHRRSLATSLRQSIQDALDASRPTQRADLANEPAMAPRRRRASMPPGESPSARGQFAPEMPPTSVTEP